MIEWIKLYRNEFMLAMFPYVQWDAIHDAQTPELHLRMEWSGIDGSGIFRRDDPLLDRWFPLRKRADATGRTACRCGWNDLTVEAAARKGIREAIEWHRTDVPPVAPTCIGVLNFDPFDAKLMRRCRTS